VCGKEACFSCKSRLPYQLTITRRDEQWEHRILCICEQCVEKPPSHLGCEADTIQIWLELLFLRDENKVVKRRDENEASGWYGQNFG